MSKRKIVISLKRARHMLHFHLTINSITLLLKNYLKEIFRARDKPTSDNLARFVLFFFVLPKAISNIEPWRKRSTCTAIIWILRIVIIFIMKGRLIHDWNRTWLKRDRTKRTLDHRCWHCLWRCWLRRSHFYRRLFQYIRILDVQSARRNSQSHSFYY